MSIFAGVRVTRRAVGVALAVALGAMIAPSAAPASGALRASAAPACPPSAPGEASAAAAARACGGRVEASSRRTELARVFANPDGTSTLEIAALPQRVHRADGAWAEIDLNLRAGPDGQLRPAASVADVAFSAGGTGPLVTLTRDGLRWTLSWPGSLPAPVVAGEQATYRDVLPEVDLVVRATRTGFTHVLVVRTAGAAATEAVRRVRLDVGGDARVVRLPDGSLRAMAGTRLLATAPPPRMWDSSTGPGAGDPAAELGPDLLASSAEHAGIAARLAPVGTSVAADGGLLLTPDAGLLAAPPSAFPLFIDPGWTAYSRTQWAYANTINRNWDINGEAWVGRNDYDGSLYRSYFVFPLTAVRSKYIYGAYMQLVLDHSWSCTGTPSHLYWTGVVSPNSEHRTNWAPSHIDWLDSEDSHANETGNSCAVQPDTTVNFGDDNSNVRNLIQSLATAASPIDAVTLGLCACNELGQYEATQDRWKRWLPGTAKLFIDWDSKPGAPNSLQVAGVACPAGGIGIGTLTPTFSAVYPDADSGQSLTGTYEWIEVPSGGISTVTDTSPTRKTPPAPAPAAAGGRGTTAAVSGVVLGKRYAFRARTTDPAPYNQTSPWSAWCEFWPETGVPAAPTITNGTVPGPGRPIAFTFTLAQDSGATITKFRYGWNGPATDIAATGTTTKTATVTLTVPKYGQNTMWVRALDGVGNLGNIGSKEITVGRPSPAVARWSLETYPGVTVAQALADRQPALAGDTPLTATSVTWPSDTRLVAGQTAHLGGSSYLATTGPVVDTTKSFSVAAWARLTDTSGNRMIATQLGSVRARFMLYYSSSSGTWRFWMYDEDTTATAGSSVVGPAPVLGQWVHLAGVYDATAKRISLYVNGTVVGTSAHTAVWNATGPFDVGRTVTSGSGSGQFQGDIADVQVFDRVLVDHDFTGMLKSDPDSGGFDEPGILTPVTVGQWSFNAGVPCYLQDLQDTCEAPDGTGFARWMALTRGSDIGAGRGGSSGLALDGRYFPAENPEPWEATTEYGESALKTGVDTSGPDPLTLWQRTSVLRTDQSFTVSAWARLDRLDVYQMVLGQDGPNSSAFFLYYAPENGGVWKFKVYASAASTDNTGATYAVGPAPAADTTWYHLVGVLDAGKRQIRLYVDGDLAQASTLNAAWQPWQATGPLSVGRALGSGGRIYDRLYGVIDDVVAYQGAMTDAQVHALYDSQADQPLP